MDKPAIEVIPPADDNDLYQPPADAVLPGAPPRGPGRPGGLELRFVTRMSRQLGDAVTEAARAEGITAGSYVRRMLMERLGLRLRPDHRSGRPIHRPTEDTAALVGALRELVSVWHALTCKDIPAAKASLAAAREAILPLVAGGPGR